jgi:hypothetical protein
MAVTFVSFCWKWFISNHKYDSCAFLYSLNGFRKTTECDCEIETSYVRFECFNNVNCRFYDFISKALFITGKDNYFNMVERYQLAGKYECIVSCLKLFYWAVLTSVKCEKS